MKKLFTLISLTLFGASLHSQNTAVKLWDLDSIRAVKYKESSGKLDTNVANPMTTGLNTSAKCARYVRDTATYDNIHLHAVPKFVDISPFAQSNTTSKMSMMVMSKMPVGTKIDIQLGSTVYNSYPGGIHSVYTGTTTLQNQWELVVFNLSTNLAATNGFAYPGSIDKMIILFNTNAHSRDTIYFDDLMGPAVEKTNSIFENRNSGFFLGQNMPNPANGKTELSFQLKDKQNVHLEVCDLLGKKVCTLVSGSMDAGEHSVEFNSQDVPNGIYLITLKAGDRSATRKMVVSN